VKTSSSDLDDSAAQPTNRNWMDSLVPRPVSELAAAVEPPAENATAFRDRTGVKAACSQGLDFRPEPLHASESRRVGDCAVAELALAV
jgi:hypothetical protein